MSTEGALRGTCEKRTGMGWPYASASAFRLRLQADGTFFWVRP